MKTIKFPNDAETYEIVDEQARQDIEDLKDNGGSLGSKPTTTQVTLLTSGWDANTLTQTVTVDGILADETAQFITVAPTATTLSTAVESTVACSGQGVNSLTFKCKQLPTDIIKMNISWQDAEYIVPAIVLISFTVGNISYQAAAGMSWSEWVQSSYNIDGYTISDGYIIDGDGNIINLNGIEQEDNCIIVENATYANKTQITFYVNNIKFSDMIAPYTYNLPVNNTFITLADEDPSRFKITDNYVYYYYSPEWTKMYLDSGLSNQIPASNQVENGKTYYISIMTGGGGSN